ncbi:MAG: PAS domain S-box protein [Promethearchaeota archaeon]
MINDINSDLNKSIEKFRIITEQPLIGIMIIQDGLFKYFNKRVTETSGYSAEEIKSWAPNEFINFVHPDDREFVAEQARKKQAGDPDVVNQYSYRSIRKNGEVYWLELFSKTINYGGRPADLVMTFDITDKTKAEQQLKESEEKFRNIANQSLMGIIIIQDGKFKYFNNRVTKLNGYTVEEIKSWAPEEFLEKTIHPEDREFVREQARKKQNGDPDVVNQYQYRIIRKDGEVRWIEIFSRTINYEGRPADLVMSVDITEEKKTENQLKDSEDKYRSILETMMVGYYECDLRGNYLYVNNEYCKILGYSKEELIGKNYQLIFDKKSNEVLINIFSQVYQTGIPRSPTGMVKVVTLKKKLIYFEGPVDLLYDSEGNKVGFYGLVGDITKRINAEQQLKESEQKFRNIAEQSLIAILILQDGVFKYFNDKVCQINGYSREEIKSWPPNEFIKTIYPDDREFVLEQARKKLAADPDVIHQYHYRVSRKDGEIRWVEVFAKTIYYEGRPADLVMNYDITDKIEAEQKLKESKEKYHRAYNQAEFYKDLFIHDINNSLQSLYSSIQLIEMDVEDYKKNDGTNELIEIMYRQIKRGKKLISNVHKLSQLESHEISLKEVELFEFLNRSIEFIKNAFQERKIQIKIDTFSEKILILGNELLQDVFENILFNSVKYNKNDIVEIIIKASQVERDNTPYWKLEFIDNGIGIEDERKERVLTRVDPDSKTTYGMGLGLSLVKKIIESYDGKIWIDDKVKGDYSKGTNVILLIQKGSS